jgi:hypothetical protein
MTGQPQGMLKRTLADGESPHVSESFPGQFTEDVAWRHLEKQPTLRLLNMYGMQALC